MPEFEPVVVLPAQRGEYAPKRGGGGVSEPLVAVDRQLRSSLVTQLIAIRQVAD